VDKSPEELYEDRLKRVEDAIRLNVPDRIPTLAQFRYFAAKYTGMACQEVFYDCEKWMMANKRTIIDFKPDMYTSPLVASGAAYEALDCRQIKWPGHGVSPNHTHQFVEGEYMKADEYDAFLEDPSDYAIRTYLPRVYGALESFKTLPSPKLMLFGYGSVSLIASLVQPEVRGSLESLLEAARQLERVSSAMSSFDENMAKLGFPSLGKVRANTAFDVISDYLRGMRGTMFDMYRQPDKLLQAIEKLEPVVIQRAVSATKKSGNPRVYVTLHRGADGFMSDKQFKTFYWPNLKSLILALIDEGLTPCPFFEGMYDSRLEYLNELPRGKVLAIFDSTDLFKAKEIIGNTVCICGNVPVSLLQIGTPDQVKDYCKKLIDVVGKGGGFIVAARSVLDEAKPENLKAMIDFTREYGVYQ